MMIIGKEPLIREFDDDVVHISRHNNFRLMAEYEEALEEHPEIDEIFAKHVDEHLHNLSIKTNNGLNSDGAQENNMFGMGMGMGMAPVQMDSGF